MVLPRDAPYGDGANIVINHGEGGGEDDDDVVHISPPIIVIENISSVSHVAIDGNIDPAPDADDSVDGVAVVGEAAAVIADDEASAASHLLSLSSATSATSIASTLSDGVSRPRSQHHHHQHPLNLRPRSVSLNLPSATLINTSTPSSRNGTRIRSMSTSNSRPRSNPRTRTPMRHVSPLLVTGRALAYDLGNTESTTTSIDDHGAEMATNGGGGIAHGEVNVQADTEVDVVVDAATASNDNNSTTSSPRYDAPLIRNRSRQRTSIGGGQDDIIPEEEEEELAVVEVAVDENRNGPNVNVAIIVVQEEEVVEAEVAANLPPAPFANINHRPASLRHGTAHWLAQPASSTVHGSTRRSSNNPTRRRHHQHQHDGTTTSRTLSNKQHPSHRKLRRWNNDRFVGTTLEHLHHTMMEGEGDTIDGSDYDQYWKQHYMPNYPCTYRSEFAKLITDETKKGQRVRERFLKGEVGVRVRSSSTITTTTMMTEEIMHRMIAEKFQKKLGVSLPKSLTMSTYSTAAAAAAEKDAAAIPSTTSSSINECMGTKIFKNLSPRIQTILSRICVNEEDELNDTSTAATTDPFFAVARQVVASFESYLISLALVGSTEDVPTALGYPPLQSQLTYDLFTKVLSSPPKVLMRSRTRQNNVSLLRSSARKNVHAVLVPTVHFYFATDEDDNQDSTSKRGKNGVGNNDGGKKCNSAFYRILLHAVCQFHGLESTSSLLTGGHREGTTKVVTVQGGWLLAPSLKVLDACMSFK